MGVVHSVMEQDGARTVAQANCGEIVKSKNVRGYKRGWTPGVRKVNYMPTIRDVGLGSANNSDDKASQGSDKPLSYDQVKAECLKEECLWEDPDFPANETSLGFNIGWGVEWKRPGDICNGPKMFVDDVKRFDVNQGSVGDCWFLSAMAAIAGDERLFHRVVPDQSFDDTDYAGVFRFQFWQFGRWVEVIIDDRLPTIRGQLIFMRSKSRNEFWSALVEKAYAKLHGSYWQLNGGLPADALTDLTGGLCETIQLDSETPQDLFSHLLKAKQLGAVMACYLGMANRGDPVLKNGLVLGHAYSITDIKLVDIETGDDKMEMVRVRNPWGNSTEWNGIWSDKSEEWNYITEDQKQEMELTIANDGEFWMPFTTFNSEFLGVDVCHLGPDSYLGEVDGVNRWEETLLEGPWTCNSYIRRTSRVLYYPETFLTNPHHVTISEPEDDGKGVMVVGIMQTGDRDNTGQGSAGSTLMGYAIYQWDYSYNETLRSDFFKHHSPLVSTRTGGSQQVTYHHRLPVGNYLIVPCTSKPATGDFNLRVFTEKPSEQDDNTGPADSEEAEEEDVDEDPEEEEQGMEDGEMDQFQEAFEKVFTRFGIPAAYGMKPVLNFVFRQVGFSDDDYSTMETMVETDLSGEEGVSKFQELCKTLDFIKLVDGGNKWYLYHLQEAVQNCLGVRLEEDTLMALINRRRDKDGLLGFDDFVAYVIRLMPMIIMFKFHLDDQWVPNLDEFIKLKMSS